MTKKLQKGVVELTFLAIAALILGSVVVYQKISPFFKEESKVKEEETLPAIPLPTVYPELPWEEEAAYELSVPETPRPTPKSASSISQVITSATPTPIPTPVPTATPVPTPAPIPAEGYVFTTVKTSRGSFRVHLITINLDTPGFRIATDAEEDGKYCTDGCKTNSLAGYVSKFSGFAGINGSYFCPPDYSSCAGKVNSFDFLLKRTRLNDFINFASNVESALPILVFWGTQPKLFGTTTEFRKDSGLYSSSAAIANYPILVHGSNNSVGNGDGLSTYLKSIKSTRGFIGWKGRTLYLGHVLSATIPDSATVMMSLGLENALNLDGGGSSALWYYGYKVGPGRLLPNAIIFAR